MTEAEWMACTDLVPMLEALRASGKATERKLRLFAVACCRRIWPLLTDERSRRAVETAEGFAEGVANTSDLEQALSHAWQVYFEVQESWVRSLSGDVFQTSMMAAEAVGWLTADGDETVPLPRRTSLSRPELVLPPLERAVACARGAVRRGRLVGCDSELATQVGLLREIFGPVPFRAETIVDKSWLGDGTTVVKLAQGIHQERAYDRMPLMADALDEVGCHDEEILAHCREQREHVRGCWVVDLLLGKE